MALECAREYLRYSATSWPVLYNSTQLAELSTVYSLVSSVSMIFPNSFMAVSGISLNLNKQYPTSSTRYSLKNN